MWLTWWLGVVLLLPCASVWAQQNADKTAEKTTADIPVGPDHLRSPRAAMSTLLSSVGKKNFSLSAETLDFSSLEPAPDAEGKKQAAERLKGIIDRLAWVDLKKISDAPDAPTYHFPPDADDPPISIVRGDDGAWRFSAETVASLDALWEKHKDQERIVTHTPWYRETTWTGNEMWRIASLFVALLLGLIVGRVGKAIVAASGRRLENRGRRYAGASLKALSRVATPTACLLGLYFGLEFLLMVPAVEMIAHTIVNVLAALLVAYALYVLVDVVDEWMLAISEKTESKLDDMLRPIVRTSLRATIVVLALVQIATILSDKPMTSVIAGLGVGGLAIGLASQDMVKNFFGSVMIFSDHPFEMGDFIEAGSHSGTVESVGFRSTRIRTGDGHVVTIPNGGLANMSIKNISTRPFLKRNFGLGLTYDTTPDQVQRAIDLVKEIVNDHEGMSEDKPPLVNFTELTDSTLNIQVVYWHYPADWTSFRALNNRVNLEILRRFNDEGLEFAFPSQSIYLAGGDQDAT
jgi:MscS family membrane protein